MDIVIDFDGTVVTHEYPAIGRSIGAEDTLRQLVHEGHNLILFTMRDDKPEIPFMATPDQAEPKQKATTHLSDAVKWFQDNGIHLAGIQTNPTQKNWTSSPKAYGQIIIDDAAAGVPLVRPEADDSGNPIERPYVDWVKMRELLIAEGLLQRASGRTTRIVDAAIQELFDNGRVFLIDHHEGGPANRHIQGKFFDRMEAEHPRLRFEKVNESGSHGLWIRVLRT